MSLEIRPLYEFGRFRCEPREHLLLCDGRPVSLTPKCFDILVALVESNGRLVSKDELMRKVWPDSFVEEANLTVNISSLRRVLGETAEGHPYIETVPKHGYRFVVPITHHPSDAGSEIALLAEPRGALAAEEPLLSPLPRSNEKPGRLRTGLVTGLLGIILIGLTYGVFHHRAAPPPASSAPRRLAILPFRDLGQNPNTNFLGLSLADAVTTKLGYVNSLVVRPSYATEKYRNQVVDIPKAAAELNVDTLLTGNYLRDGDDLRITCQLVDVKSESILWRGAFDLKYDKLLTLQDHVSQQIIKGLEVTLSPTEAERLKPDEPIDPLAYEYYLRGVDLYTRGEYTVAIKMLEKSGAIAPSHALTWAYLGRAHTANASFQFGGDSEYRNAQVAFERALALQPAQIEARIYMANLLTDTGKAEQAVPLLRTALKENPNQAELHWELGYAYRFAGMLKESVSECERARQLDPGVKVTSSTLNAYLYLGQYDKFLQSLPVTDDSALIRFYRGFAELYKGAREQAAGNFDRAFELDSSLFQAQVGKALSEAIQGEPTRGLEFLRQAESKINQRGVGDPEAIYKIAQAYAVLDDKISALRVLRHSIDAGFFSYPYFASDPLLDNLRREPEFASIMEIARQRHETFKSKFF
jgi:DNA-binding winged helix-turn-helix (wHTH) protein/TolB-like protein/Tfp pilus assembly protein PilF